MYVIPGLTSLIAKATGSHV